MKSDRSKILLDICYRYLQKAFPNLKSIYGEELSENIVYEILNIMYPLIELDHKYQTTIKKYTTFLSLYKNMIIVCFGVVFLVIILFSVKRMLIICIL